MAAVKKGRSAPPASVKRVSPLKPGLRGARNWATAQVRAASYTRRGFWRLTLSIGFLVFSIVFGALWLGGFLPDARQASQGFVKSRLVAMGFVVDRVDVMGEGRLREQDVRAALGVYSGDFLFDMDMEAAQKRVESLSWVDRAVVRRLWPDRIVVQIMERRPYALWQSGGELKLVDHTGFVIGDAAREDYADLRVIVGATAAESMPEIQTVLAQYPYIAARVDAMVQMPSGRWDLRLAEGDIRVKLPKDRPSAALSRLMQLHSQVQILDRQVQVIDLRLPDRVGFLPNTPEPV